MKTKSINSWELNRLMVSEQNSVWKSEEVLKRVKMIANTKLNNANLIKAINMKIIPVAAYAMDICRINVGELKELDQTIKRELWRKNMLGSRQVMNNCTWRKRKSEEDWSRWGILTRRQDCRSPATWLSWPIDGLKLHGERQSRRRMQLLWNNWDQWRKLEWDCTLKGNW